MEEVQVALAERRVADGTDAAFEFVENEDELLAVQCGAKLIDVGRLVGAEAGVERLADDAPQ